MGIGDYLNLSPSEAEACLQALNDATEEIRKKQESIVKSSQQTSRLSDMLAETEARFKRGQ